MQLHIINTWAFICAGLVLILLGMHRFSSRLKKRKTPHAVSLFSTLGLLMVIVGIYAGFFGPIRVAKNKLDKFWFVKKKSQEQIQALYYARFNVSYTSEPARGWGSDASKTLTYYITNNGQKTLSYISLRFLTDVNSGALEPTVDLRLKGPFKPNETRKVYLPLPDTVQRIYFKSVKKGDSNQICDARFAP